MSRKITVTKWNIVQGLKIDNSKHSSRLVSHKLLDTLDYITYYFNGGMLRLQNNFEIIDAFSKYVSKQNIYK